MYMSLGGHVVNISESGVLISDRTILYVSRDVLKIVHTQGRPVRKRTATLDAHGAYLATCASRITCEVQLRVHDDPATIQWGG
jgi:hypothetical protein